MSHITNDLLKQWRLTPKNVASQAAVTNNGLYKATKNIQAEVVNDHLYSIEVDSGKVPNQRQSGRCWLFAMMNVLREDIRKNFNLKDEGFELSQTFVYFYDKLEKSNYFYQKMIETADKPLDDRLVSFLLENPQEDGGQWDMAVAIVEKYGLVPQSVMPDTANSKNSSALNVYLNKKLRIDAKVLRRLIHEGKTSEEIAAVRAEMLGQIYHILEESLGTPPESFDFSYKDKEGQYHLIENVTPLEFYHDHVKMDLSDYVSIINAPSDNKDYYKTYTVAHLGNVIEARPVKYLNLPTKELKELTIKQLKDNEIAWYGCDVGQELDRETGLMSLDNYAMNDLFGVDFRSSKQDRLEFGESLLTHAMAISGVEIKDDKIIKWKVMNSWGEKTGDKGYYAMTDEWMDEYTYQVVVNKKYLSADQLAMWEKAPEELPAWDPMGSLAN
ncbi:C1 family peptidase [Allofustis seminis]|uniref:C1 family peptidase n=1 Tax=Allofustis seminis TaxID=166939 RepID=UPI00036BC5DA|nr:C1 family peptidase [Allofustis seminis]